MRYNPYNILRQQGVPRGRITSLPNNYAFQLNMDTWWSAVKRARDFSDLTGLDALYSYAMKSSTIIRSAIEKRLRPLKARTYGVYIDGVENERLTEVLKDSPLMRNLVYNRGLAQFTFVRVVGVEKDLSTWVYPLRNIDIINKAVKDKTYDTEGAFYVKSHVNLFWMQSHDCPEETLGLLEPIMRDYINIVNAQNNWQTASQFNAYQQMMMYYENGDEKMEMDANVAAQNVGVGKVLVVGQTTDEETGKKIRNIELENVYGNGAADTFRIFKENIEQLNNAIMQLVLGSSLLGMSDKNTNSERLVRAHLKLFRDICESDAIDVQDWLNEQENKEKLAYLLNEPELANATLKAKPASYIDIGDIDTYSKLFKDVGLIPTETFIEKSGLDREDIDWNAENINDTNTGSEEPKNVRASRYSPRNWTRMVMEWAKRFSNAERPLDG